MNAMKNIDSIAWSIAAFIVGGGLIAAVVYFTIIPLSELGMWFLAVLLPIAALLMGLGLVGTGTYRTLATLVNNRADFGQRVKSWVEKIEKDPNTPDPWAAKTATTS